MKKSPLLIALTVFLLGIALLIVPTVGANSPRPQRQAYPDSVGIAPGHPAGAPARVSLALEGMGVISPAYSTELLNNFLTEFDLTNPETLTNLAYSPRIFAADLAVDNELVYAIISNDPGSDEFITFDLTAPTTLTVISTIAARSGEEWSGMAVASDNTVYASSADCGTRSTLYTINPLTGATTEIDEITGTIDTPCISAIAISDAGTLWGVDNIADRLVTINRSTGATTNVGPLGFNANYNQGLDYDENHHALYLAAFNMAPFNAELHKLNPTTGATLISDTLGSSDPGGTVQLGWLAIERPAAIPIPAIPAITLNKTVGTDAGSCATEDEIFIDAGDWVYYCYTVTNVGDITLTNHTLTDSALGNISLSNPITLAPSASYIVTESVTITQTTVNTATWTAWANNISETVAMDTAMVTVIPEYGNAPNASIPDDNPTGVTDSITISATGIVTDINVYLDIEHEWVGDLIVTLEHQETGISIPLVNRPGVAAMRSPAAAGDCDGNNIHNMLDDDATDSIQTDCQGGDGMAYVMGASYQPDGNLDDLAANGVPFSGTWEINVVDAKTTQAGTFVLWGLEADVAEVEIDVSPTAFTNTLGIDDMSQHSLSISNEGEAVLAWDITSDVDWATVNMMTGITGAGESDEVTVTFDSTGLAEGVYTGTLWIHNNDADENPVVVTLSLTVEATPAITLSKTVGTDPEQCATENVITVDPGNRVYYCYTVQNTGDITLTQHNLIDNELGTITDSLTYVLAPGDIYSVTASTQIWTDTTNVATWAASNPGPTNLVQAVAEATVMLFENNANIEVEPTALEATLAPDETTTETLTISNTDEAPLHWVITSLPSWATVEPMTGTTTAGSDDVTVTFDSTDLGAGTYTAILLIASNAPNAPMIQVQLTLTVTGVVVLSPNIEVEPTALEATLDPNETTTETLTISNTGDADLHWVITSLPSWATVEPMTGTTGAAGSDEVTVTFDSTDLGAGTYTAILLIASNAPNAPMIQVQLTLTVTGVVVLSPNIEADTLVEATPILANLTTTETLTISNTGDADLEWTITNLPSWASVEPMTGTTAAGDSDDVTVTFDSTNLAPGTYTAILEIESNDPDAAILEVVVVLTVMPPPTAVEMAELSAAHTSNLPLALAVAGMIVVLAGGFVVRRRRTQ